MAVKLPLLQQGGYLGLQQMHLKTPGSNCPLDRLTMDINRRQSISRSQTHREQQGQEREQLAKAGLVSSSLARHGKRLFEDAVCRVGRGDPSTPTRQRSRSWQCGGPLRCYSGPTYSGSPLHNKRAKLMNEIRTRAKTASYGESFNHERSMRLPNIEETINKYGNEFKVVTKSWNGNSMNTQNMILVRISVDNEMLARDDSCQREQTARMLGSEDGTCSRKSDVISMDDAASVEVKDTDNANQGILKGPADIVMDQEQNEDAEVIEQEVKTTTSPQLLPPSQNSRPKTAPREPVSSNRPKAKRSKQPKSAETRPSPESSEPIFKCWVDDVTVSSVCQQEEIELDGANVPNDLANDVAKIALDKHVEIKIDVPVDPPNNDPVTNGDKGSIEETTVISLQDLQECEWTLPEFVCPSSEEKSKEVAIKEWLQKTSFTAADKTVPLL